MKTICGKCESSKEISLSKAAKILSKFVSTDNGASEAVKAFLRRSSVAFNELNQLHKELKSSHSHKKKNHKRDTIDDDEKSTLTVVKLSQEKLNGFVDESGDEKHKKKNENKKQKQEIDGHSRSEFEEREQKDIQSYLENSGVVNSRVKDKKEKKNKHENLENGENGKGQEQLKEIENGGIVGSQDIKMGQTRKRKFENVEDKSGDLTDKKMKRKH